VAEVLYISYDGMTDPLGQSQVIPYLIGLSQHGYQIDLISFEKKKLFTEGEIIVREVLKKNNIHWHPLIYTKSPPILSTLWDIRIMISKAYTLHKKNNFKIAHCRSYIPAFAGISLKKKFGVKFIFDIRGLWVDERVDGKIWNLANPLYKLVYRYFKKKEKEFFSMADYVISLTHKAKDEILSWKNIRKKPLDIEVIPTCADMKLFSHSGIDENLRSGFKQKLGLSKSDFILSYLGAIGTWYMPDEMLDFFKVLLSEKPNAKFLFITHEPAETIRMKSRLKNIPDKNILVQKAGRHEVPSLLSLSDFSVAFIKPAYSKIASSPTKFGELLSMGIPFICNKGIGDMEEIVNKYRCGILAEGFNNIAYTEVIKKIDQFPKSEAARFRKAAEEYFSLESGIEKYDLVYQKLLTVN
jgi:glycosyltransferase involved in cell wall biosynthesis